MKKKSVFTGIALFALCAATVFAGGGQQAGGGGADGAAKQRTFAVVYPVIHPVFEQCTVGAQEQAAKRGVKVLIQGPDTADVAKQIQIMENLIAQKVDGIAIGSTEPTALVPLINKAMDQGIKVICFDSDTPNSKSLGFIGTDHEKWGEQCGKLVVQVLGDKGGKVLVSQGNATQLNLKQRLDACKKVTASNPNIVYIDEQSGQGDPNITLSNIENMVQAHPDFDVLIGMDGAAGPAAAIVWKEKALKQPNIVGDDTEDIINGVRNGYITYTIAQNQHVWGVTIIDELMDACDGKPIPKFFDAGTRVISKANVNQEYPQ
jgi:ribose transport system substrate-binding protein